MLQAATLIEVDINSFRSAFNAFSHTHKHAHMHKTAAATKQFSWQKWRQQQNQLESSFSSNTSETKPTRRCHCCRCNVQGHRVSLCIPTCTPKIETPALNISPDRLDPVSDSLTACGQTARESDSSSAGKKVKRGCLSSAYHPQLLLHNLWACYCNQKFFFRVFFGGGRGLGGVFGRCTMEAVSCKPHPFHVKWDTAVMSLGWEDTHNTKLWRKTLCTHAVQYPKLLSALLMNVNEGIM